MNTGPGGSEDPMSSPYRMRRHLSVIQAQAELILDEADATDPEIREAIRRIQRTSYELTTLVDEESTSDPVRTVPSGSAPETVRRILVCSHSQYLSSLLEEEPCHFGGFELQRVESADDAIAAVHDREFDYVLLDAVWPDSTGVDVVGELSNAESAMPPYTLLSLYTDEGTPVALGLSGVLSPTVPVDRLERTLDAFVDSPSSASIAGFLSERPDEPLATRLESASETVVSDARSAAERARETAITADVVCLDAGVYRQLSPGDIGELRTVAPGRGRPLLLLAPTDADPFDRSWIPTLGGRRFLHRPPDLNGLLTQLLAQRPTPETDHEL